MVEGARRATGTKKRRYLSAEKKFQIYLEAQDGGKPVGELLRREGLFSTDLARIGSRSRRGRSNASAPSPVASRARSAPKPMILTCNQ
jgi:transposase-like protein